MSANLDSPRTPRASRVSCASGVSHDRSDEHVETGVVLLLDEEKETANLGVHARDEACDWWTQNRQDKVFVVRIHVLAGILCLALCHCTVGLDFYVLLLFHTACLTR